MLIFSLQSLSKASDIRDFEIQGLTIGDSLLEMYSNKEIKEFMKSDIQVNFYPKSKKFFLLATPGIDDSFDQLNVDLKYLDNEYILYGLSQYKRMEIKKCLEETKVISTEIRQMFPSNEIDEDTFEGVHRIDKTGQSKYFTTKFTLFNGDAIRIVCTRWGKEFKKKGHYKDNLDVSLVSKEYLDFLINEAY